MKFYLVLLDANDKPITIAGLTRIASRDTEEDAITAGESLMEFDSAVAGFRVEQGA